MGLCTGADVITSAVKNLLENGDVLHGTMEYLQLAHTFVQRIRRNHLTKLKIIRINMRRSH